MREILSVVYLRAICAVFIVLFHAAGRDDITGSGNSKIEQVFSLGASRVDIFFVISGFVLFIATVSRGGEAPGAFLLRRIMRIAPLYWLFTLALAFAALGFPKLFPNLSPTAQDIALSLFFVPHFSASKPEKIWPILVQGWALTYEVIFYLVFAVALFARRTKWLPIIASLFIGLVLAGLIFQPTSAVGLTVTDPVLLEFLGGAAFGQLWLKGWRLSRTASWSLLILALAGLALGTWASQIWLPWRAAFLGIPALMIVMACVMLDADRPWRKRPWLQEIGQASYSIYLIHGIVISVVAKAFTITGLADGSVTSGVIFVGVCGLAATLAGIASWRMIEKPFAEWIKAALAPPQPGLHRGTASERAHTPSQR
jgi:exopolysaccharide production protein ExoZ